VTMSQFSLHLRLAKLTLSRRGLPPTIAMTSVTSVGNEADLRDVVESRDAMAALCDKSSASMARVGEPCGCQPSRLQFVHRRVLYSPRNQ
jgi:hypothetical protein